MDNRIEIRISKRMKAEMKAFIRKQALPGIDNYSDLIRVALVMFIKDTLKDSAK